jgi:hypothetical protein
MLQRFVIVPLDQLVEIQLSIAWIGLAQNCVITPRPFDVRIRLYGANPYEQRRTHATSAFDNVQG